MDGDSLIETLTDRRGTELDRLGSEKSLVATTDARLDRESVLAAAVAAERRAAATFERWADSETDPEVRDAFERVAARERDHADRVAGLTEGGTDDGSPDPDALHAHLRDLEATPERVAAGLVARPLVSARSLLQVVNFFVNEADESAAETFRDLRSETEALVDEGSALLDVVCDGDRDRERAREAAERTVDVAYEAYERRLDALGIDPKPVC